MKHNNKEYEYNECYELLEKLNNIRGFLDKYREYSWAPREAYQILRNVLEKRAHCLELRSIAGYKTVFYVDGLGIVVQNNSIIEIRGRAYLNHKDVYEAIRVIEKLTIKAYRQRYRWVINRALKEADEALREIKRVEEEIIEKMKYDIAVRY